MASVPGSQPATDEASSGAPRGKRLSREEQDKVKSRLADQDFSIRKYPDPLAPRPPVAPERQPNGVTHEMEREWLAAIRAAQPYS